MLHHSGCYRRLLCAVALATTVLWATSGWLFAAADAPEQVLPPTVKTEANDKTGEILAEEPSSDSPDAVVRLDELDHGESFHAYSNNEWTWQWVPSGLIYHSYMAGPHEPHSALIGFSNLDGRVLADAWLGGRMGFLKYGNQDPTFPEGWQLDFYGAAISRLDVENQQDLDATDFVFGFPLTWGDECVQYKFGYAHLSSHLGDEFALSHPGSLNDRVNYVRDSLVIGTSRYLIPAWRVYGEASLAFHRDGGASLWDTQFGTEVSRPGPTGNRLSPFMAINGRLRDDDDLGGDLTVQAGWLHRGILGQTLRFGAHYYNGKSSQTQFFDTSEQQVGGGVWYDF
jgi:hypothetical protein